jgi:hypothetical protein
MNYIAAAAAALPTPVAAKQNPFFPGPSGVRVHAHSESATASIYVALLYHSAFLRPVCFLHHFYLCGLIRESPALIIIVVCYLNISVSFRFV